MSTKKIDKDTALKYFNHLKDCNGYGVKEFEMKEALENDENFKQIESEFKESIEEIKKQLPEKRLKNLAQKLVDDFNEDRTDDDDYEEEEEIENLSYADAVKKILKGREYDDYDHQNIIFEQRMRYDDMDDSIAGNPKEVSLDKVIEKMQKIKDKYAGQKIFINTVADGTMSVDRVRVYAIVKKMRPLYEVYSHIYQVAKYELQRHEHEVADFKRKQKELGL